VHANPIVKFLGLWLAGAAVFAVSFGLGAGRSAWNFYRLSHDGVLTQGTVIGLEPENHNTVRYTYKVNGQTYARADQGFSGFAVDQTVPVYYLPQQPDVSSVGDPDSLLTNELFPLVLATVTFPLFAIVAYAVRYPRFRNWLLAR
jgi:hypothetical protein